MKKKKVITALLLPALVGTLMAPVSNAAEKATVTPMKLWYDEPANSTYTSVGGATKWEAASLPIGNGILGANVFGEVGEELLTVNEETLWSGGRGSVANYDGGNPNKNVKDVYDSLAQNYVSGEKTRYNMEDLRGDPRGSSGYDDGYQPLGNLKFNFDHKNYTDYQRTMDLDNGVATVHYSTGGVNYSREYFASNPANVIVSRFTADQNGKVSFTARFESKQSTLGVQTAVNGNTGFLTVAGTVANNGLQHNTQVAVVAEGGSVQTSGDGIRITGANSATVYLTSATDYKNEFSDGTIDYWYRTGETADQLNTRVKGVLDNAVKAGYESVKNAHAVDYTGLYNRVRLDLGQTDPGMPTDDLLNAYKNGSASAPQQRYLEVLTFQYGRYLLIAGSRENSQLPTTLQGIWNDTSRTDWNSDIHTNINLQMNYWLSNNCNLTECARPLVDYMSKLKEPGGRTVEKYTGCQYGIMAHTQNTPFGYTAPGWEIGTWGWSPAAATWLMQNCYDYYQYSGDQETLRNTIYPMMVDQVKMYEELLMEKDGRKVMPIALSPEIGPVTSGNTFEQSLIWQLYADTIQAAEILGEEIPQQWRDTLDMLKPIEIGTSGQIKEWYHETSMNSVANTSSHRHLSNLLGLFPGDLIDTPEEIKAAKVSLENKNFGRPGTYNNPEGGWTYGQMINSWARVGEGNNAYFCVSQMLKSRFFENLWDYHNPAIFQIDGNYGYSAGVAEMLMQSNLGRIRLLPAISGEWANGSVTGLLAEGGFEVTMSWKDGKVTDAALHAKKDGSCSVENPFAGQAMKVIAAGTEVACTEKDDVYTFDAKAGETYTLSPAEKTPDPTPIPRPEASRDEQGHVTLTWEAKEGVTYKIYRKEIGK